VINFFRFCISDEYFVKDKEIRSLWRFLQ